MPDSSTSATVSNEESATPSGPPRKRSKQGHGSRVYANFRSAVTSIQIHRRYSLLAASGVFIGAMVVMATSIVVQSSNILFSLHLYAQVVKVLLVSIGAVSFVSGGLIMRSVLLAAEIERLREFGIRLVIGARRRDICTQLLFEVLLLSVTGGVSGSVCGLLIGFVLTSLLRLPFIVHPVLMVLLASASIVPGPMCALYPVLRASHVDPERMLRSG
ncbi:MAG: FtsX-like permease family protein [Ktedonobacteraceae bacterium]|nr:FtsX-like permease family protein [Ktedonobacteraceae bacterium]